MNRAPSPIPPVIPPHSHPGSLSSLQRGLLLAASLLVVTGFVLATRVEPDPRGFGTHQQFGLPPCTVRWLFGIPCPSCGGTTSFALFVRGQWLAAARTNLAAFGLALTCAAFVPWAWLCIARRTWCGLQRPAHVALGILIALASTAVVQWMARWSLGG